MSDKTHVDLIAAIDPDDIGYNPSNNPSFSDLIEARLSRRKIFGLGLGTAGVALLQACGGGSNDTPAPAPSPAPAPGRRPSA